MHRFYIPDLPSSGRTQLSADEAKHAAGVLRIQSGDSVEIFDGKDHEAQATVLEVGKRSVTLEINSHNKCDRELTRLVKAFVSLPKGDRQKTLVDGLTQLGISNLIPLQTRRGVAQPTTNALQRLRRSVVETCKQCRRNRLMETDAPVSIEELNLDDHLKLYAHPYGESLPLVSATFDSTAPISFAIGPEGGFSDEEVASLDALGWKRVSLGPRILRIEIAALATAAIVSASS